MNMREKIAKAVRSEVFESDAVASHMHEGAADRAAGLIIGLLREPTEAMTLAGDEAFADELTPAGIWKAMIDAAGAPEPARRPFEGCTFGDFGPQITLNNGEPT